jgi:hypothetical protein
MKSFLYSLILITIINIGGYSQIYVATTGSDSNAGTIDKPYATITKALSSATAGTTIYVRGGTYKLSATLSIKANGASGNFVKVWAYPGEKPLLDCSGVGSGNRGIELRSNYVYLKGLEIFGAGDNGMYITGGYNRIEQCVFHHNGDSGMQISGGGNHNIVVNCDSYYNHDEGSNGGNADGFSPKLDVGDANEFHGCRAWCNSDDGWDLYGNKYSTLIDSCWTWGNGWDQGNGNGFKTGGNKTASKATLMNCMSFNNIAKGFDQNHNMAGVTIYNCTSFHNATGNFFFYEVPTSGTSTFKNNISYITLSRADSIASADVQSNNSWQISGYKVSDADFVSLDTTQVYAARKSDGSLPDITLLHLATTSKLVNAGVNVGIPFAGTSPDLGAFEAGTTTGVTDQPLLSGKTFNLAQNYPNPFNPSTTIDYAVNNTAHVTLKVYDMLGKEVASLVDEQKSAGSYRVNFNAASLPSGIYFYSLSDGVNKTVQKMILMK